MKNDMIIKTIDCIEKTLWDILHVVDLQDYQVVLIRDSMEQLCKLKELPHD